MASLAQLFVHSDATVRSKASECIFLVAAHAHGRAAVIAAGLVAPLAALVGLLMMHLPLLDEINQFNDGNEAVRLNAHSALARVAATEDGLPRRCCMCSQFIPIQAHARC